MSLAPSLSHPSVSLKFEDKFSDEEVKSDTLAHPLFDPIDTLIADNTFLDSEEDKESNDIFSPRHDTSPVSDSVGTHHSTPNEFAEEKEKDEHSLGQSAEVRIGQLPAPEHLGPAFPATDFSFDSFDGFIPSSTVAIGLKNLPNSVAPEHRSVTESIFRHGSADMCDAVMRTHSPMTSPRDMHSTPKNVVVRRNVSCSECKELKPRVLSAGAETRMCPHFVCEDCLWSRYQVTFDRIINGTQVWACPICKGPIKQTHEHSESETAEGDLEPIAVARKLKRSRSGSTSKKTSSSSSVKPLPYLSQNFSVHMLPPLTLPMAIHPDKLQRLRLTRSREGIFAPEGVDVRTQIKSGALRDSNIGFSSRIRALITDKPLSSPHKKKKAGRSYSVSSDGASVDMYDASEVKRKRKEKKRDRKEKRMKRDKKERSRKKERLVYESTPDTTSNGVGMYRRPGVPLPSAHMTMPRVPSTSDEEYWRQRQSINSCAGANYGVDLKVLPVRRPSSHLPPLILCPNKEKPSVMLSNRVTHDKVNNARYMGLCLMMEPLCDVDAPRHSFWENDFQTASSGRPSSSEVDAAQGTVAPPGGYYRGQKCSCADCLRADPSQPGVSAPSTGARPAQVSPSPASVNQAAAGVGSRRSSFAIMATPNQAQSPHPGTPARGYSNAQGSGAYPAHQTLGTKRKASDMSGSTYTPVRSATPTTPTVSVVPATLATKPKPRAASVKVEAQSGSTQKPSQYMLGSSMYQKPAPAQNAQGIVSPVMAQSAPANTPCIIPARQSNPKKPFLVFVLTWQFKAFFLEVPAAIRFLVLPKLIQGGVMWLKGTLESCPPIDFKDPRLPRLGKYSRHIFANRDLEVHAPSSVSQIPCLRLTSPDCLHIIGNETAVSQQFHSYMSTNISVFAGGTRGVTNVVPVSGLAPRSYSQGHPPMYGQPTPPSQNGYPKARSYKKAKVKRETPVPHGNTEPQPRPGANTQLAYVAPAQAAEKSHAYVAPTAASYSSAYAGKPSQTPAGQPGKYYNGQAASAPAPQPSAHSHGKPATQQEAQPSAAQQETAASGTYYKNGAYTTTARWYCCSNLSCRKYRCLRAGSPLPVKVFYCGNGKQPSSTECGKVDDWVKRCVGEEKARQLASAGVYCVEQIMSRPTLQSTLSKHGLRFNQRTKVIEKTPPASTPPKPAPRQSDAK